MRPTALFTVLAALSGSAFAQTPDELTPAVETPCDPWKEEPVPFGLCNNYCEAKDCDDPRAHAAPKACSNIERKFLALTGLERMPCDEPPPEECEVTATDDHLDLEDPGPFTLDLLANDTSLPAGMPLFVASVSPVDDITLTDAATGHMEGTWADDGNAFVRRFEYTACCAEDRCDSATVTVLGS